MTVSRSCSCIPCKQDGEDDKNRYRSDVNQNLCKPNELRAKLQINRSQTSKGHRQCQYGMYEAAETHRRHRSCYRQYCEDRKQQDGPFL